MERFGSFTVDHNKLNPGIYISRVENVCSGKIYTIDLRLCKPYRDEVLSNMILHSIEHLVATNLEEISKTSPIKKIYWGPMGCQTGFYALLLSPEAVNGATDEQGMLNMLLKAVDQDFDEIPFNNCADCGNCTTLAGFPCDLYEVKLWMNALKGLIENCAIRGTFDKYPS